MFIYYKTNTDTYDEVGDDCIAYFEFRNLNYSQGVRADQIIINFKHIPRSFGLGTKSQLPTSKSASFNLWI